VCCWPVRSEEKLAPASPLKLILSVEEDELLLEVHNVSEKRVNIISRLEPGFGVVSLVITDGEGKVWPCGLGVDWYVRFLSEVESLPPGGKFHCFMPLDYYTLPHGTYKAKATYNVGRDRFYFFKQWFGQAQKRVDKPTGELWRRIENLWAGEVSSNTVEWRVKEEIASQELPKDVKALRGLLQSPKVGIRLRAIERLGRRGDEGVVAAPDLAGLLENEHRVIRLAAVDALRHLGLQNAEVVSCLCQALAAKDTDVRIVALNAFSDIERIPEQVLPLLAKAMSDDNPWVRMTAAVVAGSIGPAAKELQPALKKLLADENLAVRRDAIEAYAKILGTPEKRSQ
jgi:hypothetical protein